MKGDFLGMTRIMVTWPTAVKSWPLRRPRPAICFVAVNENPRRSLTNRSIGLILRNNFRNQPMSLSTFLDMPEVTAKIKPFRPKLPRKITAPLRARPRSNNHAILGTAIDYLLRFELKRQAPHAVTERWVAECAPEMIW